ncbi:hypothetical protein LCGC14_3096750 [marine sediment metagenome]|uniref:Uncharacterized protein n=1 Tax=marine sediment metagenome TaxID=412755 RepID=A0A0F8W8U6_9ZZZZ
MSAAYIYLGVPLSEVVKVSEVTQTVTRYNETTGKPYQKESTAKAITIAGRDLTEELRADIEKYGFDEVNREEFLKEYMPDGLKYFSGGERDPYRTGLCGIKLAYGDCDAGAPELVGGQEWLVAAFVEVREALKKCGLSHLTPRMYLEVVY